MISVFCRLSRLYAKVLDPMRSFRGRDEVDAMALEAQTVSSELFNLYDLYRRVLKICLELDIANQSPAFKDIDNLSSNEIQSLISNSNILSEIQSLFNPYLIYIDSKRYSYKNNLEAIQKVKSNIREFISRKKYELNEKIYFELEKTYNSFNSSSILMESCYLLLESPKKRKDQLKILEDIKKGIELLSFNITNIIDWTLSDRPNERIPVLNYIHSLCESIILEDWNNKYRYKSKQQKSLAQTYIHCILSFSKSVIFDLQKFRLDIVRDIESQSKSIQFEKNQPALKLIDSWINQSISESERQKKKEDFEYLAKIVDSNRIPGQGVFSSQ